MAPNKTSIFLSIKTIVYLPHLFLLLKVVGAAIIYYYVSDFLQQISTFLFLVCYLKTEWKGILIFMSKPRYVPKSNTYVDTESKKYITVCILQTVWK